MWQVVVTFEDGGRLILSEWVSRSRALKIAKRLNALKGISVRVPDERECPGFIERMRSFREALAGLSREGRLLSETYDRLWARASNASRIEELEGLLGELARLAGKPR